MAHLTDGASAPQLLNSQEIDPDQTTIGDVVAAYCRSEVPKRNWKSRPQIIRHLELFASQVGRKRPVKSIRRIEIINWLTGHKEWTSPCTRKGVITNVGRAFSWALHVELTSKNPFWRVWSEYSSPRSRCLGVSDFQILMRNSPAHFRRVLLFLRLTGCRPGELCRLKWGNVDFTNGVCVLKDHKTAKRTGKPRIIVLVPALVKMLTIMGGGLPPLDRHAGRLTLRGAVLLMRRILGKGPVTTREMRERMKAAGCSPAMIYRAARKIGSKIQRHGKNRFDTWLPPTIPDTSVRTTRGLSDPVFTNDSGGAWTMYVLNKYFRRVRARTKLLSDVTPYCFRHSFATDAIRNNVPIKMVAELIGHSRTQITESAYVHVTVDGFADVMRRSAMVAIRPAGKSR